MKISVKKIDKNVFYISFILILILLHFATYPTVHNLTDEFKYLEIANELCQGNYTYFSQEKAYHTPLFYVILCMTSAFHNFTIPGGQLVTLSFLFLMAAGWYFSLPENYDKKKFILLLLANSLLWVYSTRVMMDVPVAFFLSLGMFHMFLYIENKNPKNYAISFLMLSMGILTKEISLLYVPIIYIYLIFKREFNFRTWILVGLPLLPYLSYLILTGPEEILWLLGVIFRTVPRDYSYIPYGNLPVFLFMIGVFGPGIFSILYAWKRCKKEKIIGNFLLFTIILYVIWEVFFDFVMPVNLPRYHTVLIPFLTLLISEMTKKNRGLLYVYYLTLIYTASTGFLAAYYFHIQEGAIWQNTLETFIETIKSR